MAEDYYNILGVSRDASQADIQKAYRDLARKYHPDMNPDDKSAKKKFQKIQAAFDVLNDPKKRELYDRYGSSFETMSGGGPHGGGGAWQGAYGPGAGTGAGFGNFEDIDFGQFFGERFGGQRGGPDVGGLFEQFRRASGGRRTRGGRQQRGADLEHELQITLPTAIAGGAVALAITHASGKVENLEVKIPAGIEDGKKIRLRGQGEPGIKGGPPGDILLTVRVQPHPWFSRQGNNLVVKVPVTLAEAALGAKVEVPTPKGTVSLQVPAGTSGGMKLRVRGHGVAPKSGTAGDLLAEIQIVLPKDLDTPAREAIRQIGERYPQNPRANLQW